MGVPVRVVLVGIGGYGEVYLSALLDDPRGAGCRIVGAVEPRPEGCRRLGELEALSVPLYPSLADFYRDHQADLAVLSSPIHLHAEHTCLALDHGSHVLVEKPAAAVTADVDRMLQARERAGRFVAVGFQWSFAHSVLALKRDILAGTFGPPLRGRSLTLWPRTESYYERNDWAGKKRDAEGRWILDSPASNAMAHHLHNLLFLLGAEMERSAEPVLASARLARVNDIETFDTVAARVATVGGVELLFLASHAVGEGEAVEPRFVLEFQDATLTYPGGSAPMTVRHRGGRVGGYPPPDATSQVWKLWACVEAARAAAHPGAAMEGGFPPCGLETARPHTALIESLEASGVEVTPFPPARVRIADTPGGRLRWVDGLAAAMENAFAMEEMPDLVKGPG
jgi:predicted dehydrogenase